MSETKELNFFIESRNWSKGINWYKSQFKGNTKVIGEASPNYTCQSHFPGVPQRMYQLLPDAKLIYLVRDPIKRIIAHYLHNYGEGLESRNLEETLLDGDVNQYLDRSLYYHQLSGYLKYYQPEQILIISSELLKNDTLNTLRKIFNFLDVDINYQSWKYQIQRHKTLRKRRKTSLGNKLAHSLIGQSLTRLPAQMRWPLEEVIYFPFSHSIQYPELSDTLKLKLKHRLREDVERLRDHTGCSFAHWDI